MGKYRHSLFLTLSCLLLSWPQITHAGDAEVVRILSQIYEAKNDEQRDSLYEELRSGGDEASSSLRRIAHETQDSKIFWALVGVVRGRDVNIADIMMGRLLDPNDRFLAENLGAGIVMIKGKPVYEELRVLAVNSAPPVRDRIIRAIGYSGYVTKEDPVPTLMSLAHSFAGDVRTLACEQSLFVLRQRGKRVEDEEERIQFTNCLLPWICSDETADLSSAQEGMGKCPYPAEMRTNKPPFGIAFERPSGGYDCYSLTHGTIRTVDVHSLRTMLPVNVRRKGDFAVASFAFLGADQKRTSVDILFRNDGKIWKYGRYIRTSSEIVCYF